MGVALLMAQPLWLAILLHSVTGVSVVIGWAALLALKGRLRRKARRRPSGSTAPAPVTVS